MRKIEKIGLSLAVVSALGFGFVGCGGGSGSNTTESTQNTQVGYLADSGVEGLFYETSSGITGTTEKDGKYEFKKVIQ